MGTDGDERVVLDLLWNGLGRPQRGPRHQLTVEQLVDAAMHAADEEGVRALSMRRVAARLGVGAATLYTYVPHRAALLALMADTMIGRIPLPHTRPGSWRERTEAWAAEEMAGFREHPWLVEIDDSRFVGPHAFAWTDSAIRVFDGTGLDGDAALTVVQAVSGHVRGHVPLVIAEDRAQAWTDPDGRSWGSAQEAFLATHRPEPGRFPGIETLREPPTAVDTFEAGLGWLLDGVELRIAHSLEIRRGSPKFDI
ncbi:TetR/AcrR family transcriptional regulator C-terminal domain-containing protein [Pseudonocardia sp. NPDC046786]|uniref:TetR/AcrR family transcriptional regulator n=1 Tax=Pseudonocardia sp. NPDC046786 TaxID=3155471 RepID=UPI0033DEBBE7